MRRVLVVDDSGAQRRMLAAMLSRQGYQVTQAGSGEEALRLSVRTNFDLVLSDWMMPGMDGLALCRAFRTLPRENYSYFILLTAKNDKGAVAEGLNAGADDFLSKPVNGAELTARIMAGERLLRLERALSEKNRVIGATLAELNALYDGLAHDLGEARKMQMSLVAEKHRDFKTARVSFLLRPSGHVGGDLVGLFRAGDRRIGVYAIDVSGHGIASALLTARLAGLLSDGAPGQNIALRQEDDGSFSALPPPQVAERLNALMLNDMGGGHYFTLLLAYLDLDTGHVDMVQCGHPSPAVLATDGGVRFVGEGGMPVGLLPGAVFGTISLTLAPGERLIFYSDGFTECTDDMGDQLDEAGFAAIAMRNAELAGPDFLEALVWDLDLFSGARDFGDDLSCAMITYRGGA